MVPDAYLVMGEALFTCSTRESRYLTEYLNRRFLRPLYDEINQLDAQTLDSASPAELAQNLVAARRVDPPTLGGTEQARVAEHDGARRPVDATKSIRLPTTRFNIAIEIEGDHELLDWWPNEEDSGALIPIDDLPAPQPPTPSVNISLSVATSSGVSPSAAATAERSPSSTFVDLTIEEVHQVGDGTLSLKGIVDEERSHVEPIVAAIARQTNRVLRRDASRTGTESNRESDPMASSPSSRLRRSHLARRFQICPARSRDITRQQGRGAAARSGLLRAGNRAPRPTCPRHVRRHDAHRPHLGQCRRTLPRLVQRATRRTT